MSDISGLQKVISLHRDTGLIAGIDEIFSPGFFLGTDHFSISGVLQSRLRDFQQELPFACSLNSGNALSGLSSTFSLGGDGYAALKPIPHDYAGQVFFILVVPLRLLIYVLHRRKRDDRLLI